MKDVPSGSAHCCVTSPPYFGLRSYVDDPREIGRENTWQLHVMNLVDVFRQVRRVMRDDATCWLNYGDCYDDGTLRSMPHKVISALVEDGWYHRSTIIWSKKSPMPESVSGSRWERCRVKVGNSKRARPGAYLNDAQINPGGDRDGSDFDSRAEWHLCSGCDKCRDNDGYVFRMNAGRPTTSHEYVFLLTKSDRYFYSQDANRVANSQGSIERFGIIDGQQTATWNTDNNKNDGRSDGTKSNEGFRGYVPAGRNLWTVWNDIKQSNYKKAHFATFPVELAERCIKLGCSEYGCCSECGAQWAPVVDSERYSTRPGLETKYNDNEHIYSNPERHETQTKILDWRATCRCGAQKGRCVVLDPFGGSGTTAVAARELGIDWILCELNEEYVRLIEERLQQGMLF